MRGRAGVWTSATGGGSRADANPGSSMGAGAKVMYFHNRMTEIMKGTMGKYYRWLEMKEHPNPEMMEKKTR